MATINVTSYPIPSTELSRPYSAVPLIEQLSPLIFVSVLWFYSTVCKPVKFSQPPSFFLGLHLVTSRLLLPDHRHSLLAVLCAATHGSCAGRCGRGLYPGAYWSVHSAPFLVECVLDYGLLTLVCDPTGFNVPNLRACEVWSQSGGKDPAN